MRFTFSKTNPINGFGVDISQLKKGSVITYQYQRFGGVDFEPPVIFEAEVVTHKPFKYSPTGWAIQVVNRKQDTRLAETHIMYRNLMAVDVESITEIKGTIVLK
jgi:hypothetical protein